MQATEFATLPADFNALFDRIAATGKPEYVRVQGTRQFVVLDSKAYNKLVTSAERSETLADVLEGLAQVARGECRPAEEFFQELEDTARHAELMAAIHEGLDDIQRGETQPLDECIRELAAKFNLDLAACQK
jgi:predicted transcriptional regulator